MKAQKLAQKYSRKYYKSYPLARRLHYTLKENKLIEYGGEDEIFVVKIIIL